MTVVAVRRFVLLLLPLLLVTAAGIAACEGADLSRLGSSSFRACAPYKDLFLEYMGKYGVDRIIDPVMLMAQVIRESSCRAQVNCGGIMQVDHPCRVDKGSPDYCRCKNDVRFGIDLGMKHLKGSLDKAMDMGANEDEVLTLILFGYNRGNGAMATAIEYRKQGMSLADAMMKSCIKYYGPGTKWNDVDYYCKKTGTVYPEKIYTSFRKACKELGGTPADVPALSPAAGTVNCPDYLTNSQWVWPLKGRITSRFGPRPKPCADCSSYHKGLDIAQNSGTPIMAAGAGKVSFSGPASGYGNVVYIDHGNNVQTRYAHASKLLVSSGQEVSQGQQVALVGSTGHSTGPHLHFEIRINDKAIDPLPELESGSAGSVDPRNDIDGDGICNNFDDDMDGDSIPNAQDHDIDGDGVPNTIDGDNDNDGLPDNQEVEDCRYLYDCDGDSIPDSTDADPRVTNLDLDGDCVPNAQDDDWDNDGTPNGEDDTNANPCAGCQVMAGTKGGGDRTRVEMCVTGPCDTSKCMDHLEATMPAGAQSAPAMATTATGAILPGTLELTAIPYLGTKCEPDSAQRASVVVDPIAGGAQASVGLDTSLLTCPDRTYDNINEYRADLIETLGKMKQFYMALKDHLVVLEDALRKQEKQCEEAISQFTGGYTSCDELTLDPEGVASPEFTPAVCGEMAVKACPAELAACLKDARPGDALKKAKECSLCIVLPCCPGTGCAAGNDPADTTRCGKDDIDPVEGECRYTDKDTCEEGCPAAQRTVPPSGCTLTPKEEGDGGDLGVTSCDVSGQSLTVSCCHEKDDDGCKDGKRFTDTDACSAVVVSKEKREHALVFPRTLEECYQKAVDVKDLCTVEGSAVLGGGRTHSPGHVADAIGRAVRFLEHYDKVYPSLEAKMRELAQAEEENLRQGAATTRKDTIDILLSIERSSNELATNGETTLGQFQKLTVDLVGLAGDNELKNDVSGTHNQEAGGLGSFTVKATEGWKGAELCMFDGTVDTPVFDGECVLTGPATLQEITAVANDLSCDGCARENEHVGRCLQEPKAVTVRETNLDVWPDAPLTSLVSMGRLDPQAIFLDSQKCFDYRSPPSSSPGTGPGGESEQCSLVCGSMGAPQGHCHPELGVCVCLVEGLQQITDATCDERVDSALAAKLAACCEKMVGETAGVETFKGATRTDSDKSDAVCATAREYLGWNYEMSTKVPYCSGGTCYIDCSSLTQQVFKKHGVNIPRTASAQYEWCRKQGKLVDEPVRGDAIYFKNTYKQGISHTGIWLGDGKYLHAAGRKYGVITSTLKPVYKAEHWAGACRLIGDVTTTGTSSKVTFGLCKDGSGDLCCTGRGLEAEKRITAETCDVTCEDMCSVKHTAGSEEAMRCVAKCAGNTCLGRPDGTECEGGLCCKGQCVPGASTCEGEPCEEEDRACSGGWCCDLLCVPDATACTTDPCAEAADGTECEGGLCCEHRCVPGAMACSTECAGKGQGDACEGVEGLCCDTTCIPDALSCGSPDEQCDVHEGIPCAAGAEEGLCCDTKCVPGATACSGSPACDDKADGQECEGGVCCRGVCVAEADGCSDEDRCQTICFDRFPDDVDTARLCTVRCNEINVTCERTCLENLEGMDCISSCGDGLDNDDDGDIDEDMVNTVDDDGDGRLDEDGSGHDIPQSAIHCMAQCVPAEATGPSDRIISCIKACRALAPSLRLSVFLSDDVRAVLPGEKVNITARAENIGVFPFEGSIDIEVDKLFTCTCPENGGCSCMKTTVFVSDENFQLEARDNLTLTSDPFEVERQGNVRFLRPKASVSTYAGDAVLSEMGPLATVLDVGAVRDGSFILLPGNTTVREAYPGDTVAGVVVVEGEGQLTVVRTITHDGNMLDGTKSESAATMGPEGTSELHTRTYTIPSAMDGATLGLHAEVTNATDHVLFRDVLHAEAGDNPCTGSTVTPACLAHDNPKVYADARLKVRAFDLALIYAFFIDKEDRPVSRSGEPLDVRAAIELQNWHPRPFSGKVELSVVTEGGEVLHAANHSVGLAPYIKADVLVPQESASLVSDPVNVPADTTVLIRIVARTDDGTVWLDMIAPSDLFPESRLVVMEQTEFGDIDIDMSIVYGDCKLKVTAKRCLETCELHVDKDVCTIEPKECGCIPTVERVVPQAELPGTEGTG